MGRKLVVAVLLLAAVVSAGCSGGGGSGSSAGCEQTVDDPHESTGSPGNIVGKHRITCFGSVDSVKSEIGIQKYSGGWSTVGPYATSTITSPKAGTVYTKQKSIACGSGTYRTLAKITVTALGQIKSTPWTASPHDVANPCA